MTVSTPPGSPQYNTTLGKRFDAAQLSAQRRGQFRALLGNGAGITDASRAGYVKARFLSGNAQTLIEVKTNGAPVYNNAPVLVERNTDGEWVIVGGDPQLEQSFTGGLTSLSIGAGQHAATHGRYGTDPLLVSGFMFKPFLTRPTFPTSMAVIVEGFFYGTGAFDGDVVDLTSYIPATANHQVLVAICYDKSLQTVQVVEGTSAAFTNSNIEYVPFTYSDVLALNIPTSYISSAAVRLYNGQTSIELYDIALDLRQWFTTPADAATDSAFLTDLNDEVLTDLDSEFLLDGAA